MTWGILAYILIGLNIFGIIVSVVSFLNIKFNDLKHLTQDVKEIKIKVDNVETAVNNNTIAVAQINERCKLNHKE